MKIILFLFLLLSLDPCMAQINPERYKKHVDTLASERYQGRRAGTLGDTLSVRYIVSQLKTMRGVTLLGNNGLQSVEWSVTRKNTQIQDTFRTFNVVAVLKAPSKNNKQNESIVLGAHYDHEGLVLLQGAQQKSLHPGADDNASGVAFILEALRELSDRRKELKKDIVFIAFGAEERGLRGSSYYVNHPLLPLEKVKAMVNFDMLGRMRNKGITIRGTGTANESIAMLASLENPDKLDLIWEMRGEGPTDYASFYRKGIPAFSFSTRLHSEYHTPKDTPDKVNYEGMVLAHRYIMPLIIRLATDDFLLTYKPN